jgi:hypothetical protein
MVEDRRTFEPTESMEDAERLFIEDFDTWDMTGYYLYSKYWRAGVSAHIGTGGRQIACPRAASRSSGRIELLQIPHNRLPTIGVTKDCRGCERTLPMKGCGLLRIQSVNLHRSRCAFHRARRNQRPIARGRDAGDTELKVRYCGIVGRRSCFDHSRPVNQVPSLPEKGP